jgi:hypothetical protein
MSVRRLITVVGAIVLVAGAVWTLLSVALETPIVRRVLIV